MSDKSHDPGAGRQWYETTALYVGYTGAVGALYLVLHFFWGSHMVVTIGQLVGHGLVLSALSSVWFIFAWAIIVTLIVAAISRPWSDMSRINLIARGWWVSLNAGVFEEVIYRILILLIAMVVLTFLNWATFGLVAWLYGVVLAPLANFFTFHALAPQLLHQGWLLGASIVFAAGRFRKAHTHLGLLGLVNAWFMGMVLFWLLFNYGLLAAIAAHVIYDVVVFTTHAFMTRCHGRVNWPYLLSAD